MQPQPERVYLKDLDAGLALDIGALLARTWPKPEKDAGFRARQLMDLGTGYRGPEERRPCSFIVREGGRIVAHALAEPRVLGTSAGDLPVAALGKVCSDPELRGRGLGALVVRGVFGLVDAGLYPFSYFQTSHAVRPFYERLGAVLADNRVVDSTSTNPEADPFWDEVRMRYPAGEGWPTGAIDLRGPGY